jgi:lysophospholipase L1-like esterase
MKQGSIFERHPKTTIAITLIFMLLFVEMISFGIIWGTHLIFGQPSDMKDFAFHPLFTGKNLANYASRWNEFHPVYGYEIKINVSDDCGYTTDRYGFIHNGDSTRKIRQNAFKIFVLGGSTVAGHGASCNDQTIPAQLERLISEKYNNVQVINAGVPGQFSATELSKAINEIVFYNPNLVLSLDGSNDFKGVDDKPFKGRENTYFLNGYQKYISKEIDYSKNILWSCSNLLHNIVGFTEKTYTRFVITNMFLVLKGDLSLNKDLIANTKALSGDTDGWDTNYEISDKNFEPMYEKNAQYFFTYIRMTQLLLKGMGIEHVFFLQPQLAVESRELSENETKALKIFRRSAFLREDIDTLKRRRYFWHQADEKFAGSGLDYVNLTNLFPDKMEVYTDPVHYNDKGNEIIAQKMFEVIEFKNLIPEAFLKPEFKVSQSTLALP